ncbi:MAG: hypothetical protein AB7L76_05600 [Burkholderiaceae bacterium]
MPNNRKLEAAPAPVQTQAVVPGALGRVLFEMGHELEVAAQRIAKHILHDEGQEEIRPFLGRLLEHGRVLRGLATESGGHEPMTAEEAVRRVLLVEVSDVE